MAKDIAFTQLDDEATQWPTEDEISALLVGGVWFRVVPGTLKRLPFQRYTFRGWVGFTGTHHEHDTQTYFLNHDHIEMIKVKA